MSIATAITAAQNKVAAAYTACDNAGATMPATANQNLSNLPDTISTIGMLVPTAGNFPVVEDSSIGRGGASLTATGVTITIPVTGTYRLNWSAFRRTTGSSYTWSSRLYRTRSGATEAIGTEVTTWTNTYYQNNTLDIECQIGDVIEVYVACRGAGYGGGGNLSACVAQKLWTN